MSRHFRRAATPGHVDYVTSISATSLRGNLPQPLTRLIGREAETARVRQLLAEQRLVTLTGSGGVGKTRLALHIAEVLLPAFPAGAWWVDLEPVTDEAIVSQTVADSLGISETAGHSMAQTLAEYLAHKQLLLVLDNCEHVTGRVGQLARDLLRATSQVRILVTSQQALGIPGESVWRVPSLAVPPAPSAGPAGHEAEALITAHRQSEGGSSVQLFVERAQAILPTFTLTAGNAIDVAQICRRLNGIPLAIELAASRVRLLTPHEIADRLDDMLGLLARQAPGGLARHQTLRARRSTGATRFSRSGSASCSAGLQSSPAVSPWRMPRLSAPAWASSRNRYWTCSLDWKTSHWWNQRRCMARCASGSTRSSASMLRANWPKRTTSGGCRPATWIPTRAWSLRSRRS